MLNITNHQGSANQSHDYISPHIHQNSYHGYHQEDKRKQELVRMWWKRNTYTLLVGMYLVQPLLKTLWRFLKKLKIDQSCDPAILLLGIYPKEMKTVFRRTVSFYNGISFSNCIIDDISHCLRGAFKLMKVLL